MEFTFTPVRVAVLVLLIAGFWFAGGFHVPSGGGREWIYMIALYLLGAVSTTVVDHWVGNLDRSNLRFMYIVLGILACGGGLMYLHILKERQAILLPAG